MTCLAFLKENEASDKMAIPVYKQGQALLFIMMIYVIQNLMLSCMLVECFNRSDYFRIRPAPGFEVYMVRFCGALAMQLMMAPEVRRGMMLMNYVNNHPEKFSHPNICALLGFFQVSTCFYAQGLNVYLLAVYPTVFRILKHFLSLRVAVLIPGFFFGALNPSNRLREVFKVKLQRTNKSADIKFSDRSCFQKLIRILYKLIRGFYVSCIYYFIPFVVLGVQNVFLVKPEKRDD